MKDSTQEEISRAKALVESGDYGESLEIVDAICENKDIKDPMVTLDALILKAEISWRSGKLDAGIDTVDRAEKLIKSKQLTQDIEGFLGRKGKLLSHAGVLRWYRGDLEQAMECHQDCLRIREELGDSEGVSVAFNNLGLVYWTKGNLDKATECYKKSLTIYEELNDENGVSKVLNNLANISASEGALDQALKYHQQSLEIKERVATKQDVAVSLINIGVIFRLKGDLDEATEYYNKSLAIQKDLSIGPEFALALNNLGEIYSIKGELDFALEFYQRSLLIYEDMGQKEGISLTLANIGECHQRKGDPDIAFEYYQRSLAISKDMGNNRLIAGVLGELIGLALDASNTNLAKEYLSKLEQVNEESDSVVVNQQCLVSSALVLRKSGRTRERAEAEEILEQVVDDDIADHTVTVTAMIHLCDLLILELKATGDDEILQRIKDLTYRLASIAHEQASHPLIVETYLLQSKLAMVDFDIKRAEEYMTEAAALADEKGLQRLAHIVERESKALQYQLKRWESLLQENPSKQDMVDLTNLNDLLERMVQKTVETIGAEKTAEPTKSKYKLVHQDLLKGTDKSEKSKFRVGIAQMGLSQQGDILNELYEEKTDGLIGLRNESVESIRDNAKRMIEKAHSEGVSILIFPEMTIDLSYDSFVEDLTNLAKKYDMYIIPGSFHDQKSKRNICRVFGPDGILWEQEKHIPAIIHIEDKRFIEKIETETDFRNTIISNTEYGRIAITICRDFLDMDLRVELKNSDPPVDLVINPAFTPVTADFKAAHFDARRSIYAYCFFANVAEFGDSLIYTPEKERIERNVPRGEEGIIYKDVDLFQLRAERKKWEEEKKKQLSFIQSTR
ncbi:MAG: tetratricopeptide repeat protein [Candidatus Thorarchaeota archaeon]